MTYSTDVHSDPPIVKVSNIRPPEKDIYKQMWDKPEYRHVAPGEHVAFDFLLKPSLKKVQRCWIWVVAQGVAHWPWRLLVI
jgi:hypothetical protein